MRSALRFIASALAGLLLGGALIMLAITLLVLLTGCVPMPELHKQVRLARLQELNYCQFLADRIDWGELKTRDMVHFIQERRLLIMKGQLEVQKNNLEIGTSK